MCVLLPFSASFPSHRHAVLDLFVSQASSKGRALSYLIESTCPCAQAPKSSSPGPGQHCHQDLVWICDCWLDVSRHVQRLSQPEVQKMEIPPAASEHFTMETQKTDDW